jgi:putative transposase
MLKSFKYKINPTKEQSILLNKHIGASRFVFNLALECKQMAWVGNKINLSCFTLHNQLKDLKNECEWLKEVNSQSLQQSIINLDKAYTAFFKRQNSFPSFKKKSNGGSFNIPQNVTLDGNKLIIPKFKKGIDIVLHRPIKGEIRQATIRRTPTGKYFVSILCETGEAIKSKASVKENTTIGIDLGIKTYLISSNGKEFDNPKFLRKAQSRLKFVQRKYSKYKGSRTKHRLAILHEKVANQRKDFLHKTSIELIKNHESIAIEDLAISNMIKNHNLAQAINDASWSTFVNMLEYKAEWYGINILKIGRFDASSKTCSCCGYINKELTLKDRSWICFKCNSVLDRDMNAAINIKSFALKKNLSVERRLKIGINCPSLLGVMTSEAHYVAFGTGGSFTNSTTCIND